ncbi:MAG: hypothetical protein A2571_01920 [Candidatus Vogelbacteria bacterium RIFOXYD1_FULL_44_32]|uniref:site-specific DNA-methyltransferase (adenine-specific) n=1 Tax=Candidatus Vogelbacteria bacterium RIFOXYD1_FULL_44_32 TaxID=1802438 RepID=A0A1G2QEV5_9BACT|nr:MAG: hypothetical protein A2571_01920 [Candidatus Vogelbacteria bacterium RIFOXYD1_FULL_44_32]
MNKTEATTIINKTFSSSFDEDSFNLFVSNLFKEYEPVEKRPFIKNAFTAYVSEYKIIGHYKDSEEKEIDILKVHLNHVLSIERARTAQRNFVADYLKTNGKNAALVAFVSPKYDDWRLSLVRLEHSLEVVDEKLKTKEEITPAKRWSFLVGKNEGSHTAQSRFTDLLVHNERPTLTELELAFDIEKVTKEFFDKYTELYFKLKEHLDEILKKDEKIKSDFESKEISTVDFAKKTLGQIVFLYFLQKKGWFGVAADKEWGEGPKKFIRLLFGRRGLYGKNFFNDVLEPLFYEALAQDRGKESIYPRLNNCRMPFLNGGLFEPMNGYQWETTDVIIPDELFSNTHKTKEGDIGDGILDVFDRYNFTVNENEPLEKEVAVDPEMLGKVFENLLDIKDRKSKGAFYTPREIVHYMCQQSLINYLETETNGEVLKEDIETFINKGDFIIENDKIALEREKNRKAKGAKYEDKTYALLLPESIRAQADTFDKLLKEVKVADPAVGSGAFPLGMINEIVRARKVLNIYNSSEISDYDLKLHTISNSIHGVDIDPGAVEIAKLRLWLALVVEEKEPHPLPNLEHKIMQGNSLISEYEGIKLFDENIIEKRDSDEVMQNTLGLGKSGSELKMEDLQNKIELYVNESQRSKKQKLKQDIDNLKWELIEVTLEEQKKVDKLVEIKKFRRKNIRPFFIWRLEFSDVFKKKGGFDVVIGNPPYGFRDVLTKKEKEYFRKVEKIEFQSGDSAELFCKKSFDTLLKDNGILSFIIPKKCTYGDSWGGWRTNYFKKYDLHFVLDSGKAFDRVLLEQTAFGLAKKIQNAEVQLSFLDSKKDKIHHFSKSTKDSIFKENNTLQIYLEYFPRSIFEKIQRKSEPNLFVSGDLGLGIGIDFFSDEETPNKLLKGIDIDRWNIRGHRYLKNREKLNWKKAQGFLRPKVICQRLVAHIENPSPHIRINACFDSEGIIITNTITAFKLNEMIEEKFWLAYLNSSLVNWYTYNFIYGRAIRGMDFYSFYIEQIPIPNISHDHQSRFVELVNQILDITKDNNYDSKNVTAQQKFLEKQIDEMVMDLYELTQEEKEIVHKT